MSLIVKSDQTKCHKIKLNFFLIIIKIIIIKLNKKINEMTHVFSNKDKIFFSL